MPIMITDDDAKRLLSIPEAIEAMRVCFSDLAEGAAVNPPRLRYSAQTPDDTRRYFARGDRDGFPGRAPAVPEAEWRQPGFLHAGRAGDAGWSGNRIPATHQVGARHHRG